MVYNGSRWNKWDLHIHTPYTKLSDNFKSSDADLWELYCKKIEESDVSVFGITDYFSCENYYVFLDKFNALYPESKKVFFLNIEFRLEISVNKEAEEINLHVIFSNQIERNQIDEFLIGLKTLQTNASGSRISCKSLNSDQFISATVTHTDILKCLKEIFGNEKPYLILAAANNAGLRPVKDSPRKLSITDEIDKICDAFFGGRQNVKYYLKENRYETDELAKKSPVICGCDAHSFEDIDISLGQCVIKTNPNGKEEITKDITWIKSDLTFEGLRQILYEPISRVSISDQMPREPIRKIESFKLNFPASTYIKRSGSKDRQKFCLNQIRTDVFFSPYFSCLVGGRGTGKSTIINLLGERLGEKTDFFKQNELIIDNARYDIENDIKEFISINGTNEVEFVSQGKVERLAEGEELTKLIFNERIRESQNDFFELDNLINSKITLIDNTISLLFNYKSSSETLKELKREKTTKQNIIDSVNDEKYKLITKGINDVREEISAINKSKVRYENLLISIRTLLVDHPSSESENDIESRISEILDIVKGIEEINIQENEVIISPKLFEELEQKLIDLNEDSENKNQELKSFFEEKGMSEESIKDSQKANERVATLNSEIELLNAELDREQLKYKEQLLNIGELQELHNSYEVLIGQSIDDINSKLKISNENVLEIKFNFDFNHDELKEVVFSEFYNTFSSYQIGGTSKNQVKEVLFLIEPNEVLDYDYNSFKTKLDGEIDTNSIRRENNYVKIVTNIFSSKINLIIYKLILTKHLYNFSKFIKIQGYYGSRELQNCSFGQRCTAVIITLLMTGVKPLIIDEPEAHLDNRLIADYLVTLLKSKKMDRQIIFATHNSNFVVNGDSELIHMLEIPLNQIFTNITSTSIENLEHREKLLKLEGGKEAFLNREQKYGIN